MSAKTTPYRFRPRFVGLSYLSISLGVTIIAGGISFAPSQWSKIGMAIAGGLGVFLGFAYLKSPAWSLAVEVQDADLVVWRGLEERLRLPWTDIKEVVTHPEGDTLYINGGSPELSLLIPGAGAEASYDIKHKKKLIEEIVAKIDPSLLVTPSEACSPKTES